MLTVWGVSVMILCSNVGAGPAGPCAIKADSLHLFHLRDVVRVFYFRNAVIRVFFFFNVKSVVLSGCRAAQSCSVTTVVGKGGNQKSRDLPSGTCFSPPLTPRHTFCCCCPFLVYFYEVAMWLGLGGEKRLG